jgi:large subunit ribosomal protein L24
MEKFHVKKGDEIIVLAGTEKGKRGKIIRVDRGDHRVVVEGLKMIKRHMRKSQANPNGTILEREGTIHISNVMLVAEHERRKAKHAGKASA